MRASLKIFGFTFFIVFSLINARAEETSIVPPANPPLIAEPSAADLQKAINSYVDANLQGGVFPFTDTRTGKIYKLRLLRIRGAVNKAAAYYFTCTDFQDTETGELLDLDMDIQNKDGAWLVNNSSLHKINGAQRYTYDVNNNRVMIPEK